MNKDSRSPSSRECLPRPVEPGSGAFSPKAAKHGKKPETLALLAKMRCNAKNRQGQPCKIASTTIRCNTGAWRCRFHGGLSTGPKTIEGRRRSGLGFIAYNAQRRALKANQGHEFIDQHNHLFAAD